MGDAIRPWALKVSGSAVYVGAVCETSLKVFVFQLVGGAFVAVDLDSTSANTYLDLSYARELVYSVSGCDPTSGLSASQWHTWSASWPSYFCNKSVQ